MHDKFLWGYIEKRFLRTLHMARDANHANFLIILFGNRYVGILLNTGQWWPYFYWWEAFIEDFCKEYDPKSRSHTKKNHETLPQSPRKDSPDIEATNICLRFSSCQYANHSAKKGPYFEIEILTLFNIEILRLIKIKMTIQN